MGYGLWEASGAYPAKINPSTPPLGDGCCILSSTLRPLSRTWVSGRTQLIEPVVIKRWVVSSVIYVDFDPVLMELVLLTLLRIQFNGKTWPNVMNSVLICFIVTLVTVFLTVARKLWYISMIDYLVRFSLYYPFSSSSVKRSPPSKYSSIMKWPGYFNMKIRRNY